MRQSNRNRFSAVAILLLGVLVMAGGVNSCGGVGGCGPRGSVSQATVTRLWVDNLGERGSAYMVATDKGVFEVDNGILLGMWNADEVYGSLKPGKTYDFATKGRKVQNLFMQEYPRIVRAVEIVGPEK